MENKNILIVDDELMIKEAVSAYFSKMGFTTHTAENGQDALAVFWQNQIDLIILDLMLPGISGEEVCKEIRQKSNVPIIMLTAKTGEESLLTGLKIGADDYVKKPFSVKELFARAEAILRRSSFKGQESSRILEFGDDLSIDFDNVLVKKNGNPLSLTKSEWRILSSMANFPKKVFTREELVEIALGGDSESFDRAIDTHIKNLRKKVESDPRNPVYIKTVHGLGYRFGGED